MARTRKTLPARADVAHLISAGVRVSSRGRFNPRGVKRKMSNFHVRHRGELLHQRHQPTPVLRI